MRSVWGGSREGISLGVSEGYHWYPLRARTPTPLASLGLPEKVPPPPRCPQPRRSRAAHRCGEHPFPSLATLLSLARHSTAITSRTRCLIPDFHDLRRCPNCGGPMVVIERLTTAE